MLEYGSIGLHSFRWGCAFNRHIVSCRAARAGVRAVWMPSGNQIKFIVFGFSVSLFGLGSFPFSLVRSSESKWVQVSSS